MSCSTNKQLTLSIDFYRCKHVHQRGCLNPCCICIIILPNKVTSKALQTRPPLPPVEKGMNLNFSIIQLAYNGPFIGLRAQSGSVHANALSPVCVLRMEDHCYFYLKLK